MGKRRDTALQARLERIEEQGKRLRRRRDYLRSEADFLVEMMLARPYEGMAAHRRLLQEWEKEIDELDRSLAYLREEYKKLTSYEL